jgi:hypothetical protein
VKIIKSREEEKIRFRRGRGGGIWFSERNKGLLVNESLALLTLFEKIGSGVGTNEPTLFCWPAKLGAHWYILVRNLLPFEGLSLPEGRTVLIPRGPWGSQFLVFLETFCSFLRFSFYLGSFSLFLLQIIALRFSLPPVPK